VYEIQIREREKREREDSGVDGVCGSGFSVIVVAFFILKFGVRFI